VPKQNANLGFDDGDGFHRVSLPDRIDHFEPADDFPENGVLSVQMGLRRMSDEELAAVGIGAGIGHGDHPALMPERISGYLILEPVSGATPSSPGRVPTLDHEIADDPVKGNAIIKILPGQEDKIVYGPGSVGGGQFHFDDTSGSVDDGRVSFSRIDLHGRGGIPLLVGHPIFSFGSRTDLRPLIHPQGMPLYNLEFNSWQKKSVTCLFSPAGCAPGFSVFL
jgi:hypothetical protein